MKQKITPFLVFFTAVAVAGLSLLLPVPKDFAADEYHAYLGVTLAMAVVYVGASGIFLKSLSGFTPALKRAYLFLCIGFSLLGLASIELPLAGYSGNLEELFRNGLAAVPYLVALSTLVIGTHKFAKLFKISNFTVSYWFVIVPPFILGALFGLLPHASTSTAELQFDVSNGFNIMNAWVNTVILIQLFQIKKRASIQYSNALAWLIIAVAIQELAVLAYLAVVLPLGDQSWILLGAFPFVPLLVAGIGLLRASYAFSRITAADNSQELNITTARNFFGKPLRPQTEGAISSVDIVTFAANLVSNQKDIDTTLDELRIVTATMHAGDRLTPLNEARLMQTYLSIEQYLLEKEPVRSFTKDSLRQTIANGLRLTGNQQTFWSSLP